MNGCEEWEELLLQYRDLEPATRDEADRHVAACAGCRSFLEALEAVDAELTAALAEVKPAPGFETRVRARALAVRPAPGWIIEALDGIGWLSIAGIVALLAAHWRPEWAAAEIPAAWLKPGMLQSLGIVLIAGALAYGVRTWRELAG